MLEVGAKVVINKAEKANSELARLIGESLPMIDEILDAEDRGLSSRPLVATDLLLDSGMVKVNNAATDKRYTQVWYAIIFAIVDGWYERRYGPALRAREGLLGVVQIHGLPYRVNIPETYGIPNPTESTSDLCFGPSLGDVERPRTWIVNPPALDALSQRAGVRLDEDLKRITKLLRTINLRFMMADPAPDLFTQQRSVVLGSIRKAADHLARRQPADTSAAVWEVHFALECAIKAVIAQAGAAPPFEHSLSLLLRAAKEAGAALRLSEPLAFMPTAHATIALRYGGTFKDGHAGAWRIYNRALPLIAEIAEQVRRTYWMGDGASITLRKPPWLDYVEPAE